MHIDIHIRELDEYKPRTSIRKVRHRRTSGIENRGHITVLRLDDICVHAHFYRRDRDGGRSIRIA